MLFHRNLRHIMIILSTKNVILLNYLYLSIIVVQNNYKQDSLYIILCHLLAELAIIIFIS